MGRATEVWGVVRDALPNGIFRVELPGGHRVRAHVSGTEQLHLGRILVGDRVGLVLSPVDPGRGRIVSIGQKGTER